MTANPGAAAVVDGTALGLGDAAAREVLTGATLGLAAAVPLIVAMAIAGGLVDQAARLRRGPYAALFTVVAGAVFVGIDGHVAMIAAIADSYHVPAGARSLQRCAALVPLAVRFAARVAGHRRGGGDRRRCGALGSPVAPPRSRRSLQRCPPRLR